MPALLSDLRSSLRQIRRAPAFAAAVIATLALGIGANTAIFSVVSAVLLAPLPFRNPGRLVALPGYYSYLNYRDLRTRVGAFSGLAAYSNQSMSLTGAHRRPRQVRAVVTAGALFRVLGVRPARGRGFRLTDDQSGAVGGANAAVLSHRLWVRAFGATASVLGRRILLNGRAYQVVGVMPAGFQFPLGQHTGLWTTVGPLQAATPPPPITAERGTGFLSAVGRLRPGVTLAGAQAQVTAVAHVLARRYPNDDAHFAPRLVSLRGSVEGRVRGLIWLLFGAVGLVLLIACVNVANLLLARGLGRRREMSVRAALGAGRGALTRLLLAESAVFGAAGGALGLLLAAWLTAGLLRLAPGDVPRLAQAGIRWPVMLFALGSGLGAGLLFGWLPAAGLSRADLRLALNEGGRAGSESRRQRRWRGVLVAAEISLALALSASAGLLLRSFARLESVAPGFAPRHLLTAAVNLPDTRYAPAQRAAFARRLTADLAAQRGIRSAAVGLILPFSGFNFLVHFNWPARPVAAPDQPAAPFNIVTPGYFRTLGVRPIRGRAFTAADTASSPPVMLVNQAFARKYFPGENPVGRLLAPGLSMSAHPTLQTMTRQIVGLVPDLHQSSLRQPAPPMIFVPEAQFSGFGELGILIRTQGAAAAAAGALRAAVARLDPTLPVYAIRPMRSLVAGSMARLRFALGLIAVFAALALLLAAVGLYALMAQLAAQRRREVGIRLALGAPRGEVLRRIVGQGMALALAGAAAGLVFSWAAARSLGSLLFGVSATDWTTFAAAAVLLLVVALAACYLPARRAARVDPAVTLREE